jgi:hypothetical protein
VIEPPAVVTAEDWERCSPWLRAALIWADGTHDLADVLTDIEANRATFWPFERSALVTQIVVYPKLTALTFWLAGGNMTDLLSHEPDVIAWGARHGCERVAMFGRKGWVRRMAPLGYRPGLWGVFKDIVR